MSAPSAHLILRYKINAPERQRNYNSCSMTRDTGAGRDDEEILLRFGERLRAERARQGLSRRTLAEQAGISERYITQIERGRGNVSLVILRRIAAALGLPLATLLDRATALPSLMQIHGLLSRLSPEQLEDARRLLSERFGETPLQREGRIALIGMRGAGKSTLGQALGEELGIPFFELDREVERLAGTTIGSLLEMYGHAAYRRYESDALAELLGSGERFIVATGGGIVTEPATWARLRRQTITVWVRATPEEHMSRVIAQGDYRPMAGSRQAMQDLERILEERTPLYSQADITLNTSGRSETECVRELMRALATDLEPR